MMPASVTVRIRCSGTLHRITWTRGRLHFHNHTASDLTLAQLLHAPHHCAKILEAVHKQHLSLLPRALALAVTTHPTLTRLPSTPDPEAEFLRTTFMLPCRGKDWIATGTKGRWITPLTITIRIPTPGHAK